MSHITIHSIKISNFEPRTLSAEIEVVYTENNAQERIIKKCILKDPITLVNKIFLEIKSKNRMLFDDTLTPEELLERYSPINVENEEQIEEKMFNFIKTACDKARSLKTTKEAKEHMKIINEFKTSSLTF